MKEENYFVTTRLQAAAFFEAKGLTFLRIEPDPQNPQVKQFIYPKKEALDLLEEFKNGAHVCAKDLFDAYFQLRAMVFPVKQGGLLK